MQLLTQRAVQTVKPPEVVKAPPSRPKDLAAEKKLEESKKAAPPPPPPAEKTPEPEKKVLKESVAQAVKNETPPPPPPSDKTKSPLRSATPPPPPASKASGNDKESEKTNAHVPSNEVEELKKRLEIAEKKLVRCDWFNRFESQWSDAVFRAKQVILLACCLGKRCWKSNWNVLTRPS